MDPARVIRDARFSAGLTQAELAQRSGTSQTAISAYEHGAKAPNLTTLDRLLAAAGRRLTTVPAASYVRTPTSQELEERARILRKVIDLAERFPVARRRALRFPGLPKPHGQSR